ncbi:MAG: hypothetical protein ACOC2H_07895 [Spirochaetota bacterium]
MKEKMREILYTIMEHVTGFGGKNPLGGYSIDNPAVGDTGRMIADFFREFLAGGCPPEGPYGTLCARAVDSFMEYYTESHNHKRLIALWDTFTNSTDEEKRAEIIMKICVPELDTADIPVLAKWKLTDVEKNPRPYTPEEITIQLNALYSFPESIDPAVPDEITAMWHDCDPGTMVHIADYDHPVPLFCNDAHHELVNCLREMDNDIAFEKETGVIPHGHRVPVTVSISVTHDGLDPIANSWVEWLLQKGNYRHLSFIVLSEQNIRKIRTELFGGKAAVFSVFGKYAVHFNALKYSQLLLEKAYGIRAGFKLDTDEGMRSRDLYAATGKTWFQTLCHSYWGGSAVDNAGKDVYLGINEGEYINSTDIDTYGYTAAYRMPEVTLPSSYINQQILFFKGYAQGYVTRLYNTVESIDECISHPVVKGGGYGIDNTALKRYNPFALSIVGRAEDQQYYFNGLSKGLRGIFHPDLRIAHYKQSVQTSETKQKGTKFLGDMYRLLIFSHIVTLLGVKNEIDPFPGLFAGTLSHFQYFFNLMYQSFSFSAQGKDEIASYLVVKGLPELESLIADIQKGTIDKRMEEEERQWKDFVTAVESLDPQLVRRTLDTIIL